ncbi:MAG: prolipoprotein diacylglyceryl transferase [Spirochaetes bacterium]|nr:prolipoprotein diacylglyceryl transferase [Spirochaetota bacterium]
MYPIIVSFEYFGEIRSITTYSLLVIVGIFIATLLIVRLAQRRGIDSFDMASIIALLVASGLLFSLLTHFLLFLPERLAMKSFLAMPVGIISWGGVLGGFFAGLFASRFWKIPLLKLGDIVIPGVPLGFGIGRIGCHFGGCCFGLHYEGPLSLTFTHPMAPAAASAQPLFPIQLLSAALLFILCLILLRVLKMNLRAGMVVVVYAVFYSAGRFVIEFFRDDPHRVLLHMTDAQIYSIFLFSAGAILFTFLRRSKSHSHAGANAH